LGVGEQTAQAQEGPDSLLPWKVFTISITRFSLILLHIEIQSDPLRPVGGMLTFSGDKAPQ